jgi:hypothetical protein
MEGRTNKMWLAARSYENGLVSLLFTKFLLTQWELREFIPNSFK